ncbi:MAG: thiamine-phosphate kinase [Deltaproteobacteria bacterium]|jgi:thiamine-monophosphate kinase|nr:thiamine-phosphate kinase [Deltaproteobacteria bacterium]
MPKVNSEDQILSLLDAEFPRRHPGLILGRGDDCAEFFSASPLAVSSDLFLEHIHFRRSYFTAEEVGYKALAVNLSDLAAAGAYPSGFSLNLICPPALDSAWLAAMFKGMAALARECDLPLVGGDISAGASLGLCITVWGGSRAGVSGPEAPGAFLRRGAQEGDVLFLLGPQNPWDACSLGLAALGLEVLEKYGRAAIKDYPEACAALLSPKPMLSAGQAMSSLLLEPGWAGRPAPLKAMDLSDGLRRDLPRLLGGFQQQLAAGAVFAPENCRTAASLGAGLTFTVENLHPELTAYHAGLEQKALGMALSGGDEYALLCACAPEKMDFLRKTLAERGGAPALQILGLVTEREGIRWQGIRLADILPGTGFDHFEV